jgi:cyclomaltodextrinase / maltogenic alpha-amylase / neopullulanase
MRTKAILFFACITIFIAACNTAHVTIQSPGPRNALFGLASPIQLQYDTTWVHMSDYFVDYQKISQVTLENRSLPMDSTGLVQIIGNCSQAITSLKATVDGNTYDIPVFKSGMMAHTFSYRASTTEVKKVEMAGSINGWNRKATPLIQVGDHYEAQFVLQPGLYQYRIWEDDKEMMDANNPLSVPNGLGAFNNTFEVGDAKAQAPFIIGSGQQEAVVELTQIEAVDYAIAFFDHETVPVHLTGDQIHVTLSDAQRKQPKGTLRVFGAKGDLRSNEVVLPIRNGQVVMDAAQIDRSDMHKAVMYFLMVDRFNDGNSANNFPTNDASIQPKANNLGGDLSGITAKIKSGYFQSLGINTIWISPITTNAEGAWGLWNKGLTSTFSAYHGYWPTSLRTIDYRFGNEAEFKELIQEAHAQNMNVILDYVAHHVHQNHPLLVQKSDWTTPLYLPDGRMNTELWDEERLTTWFDTFLPTLNFAKPEVVAAMTDTAMHWVTQYELDGFRHDATKHIREEFWRGLTTKIKQYQQTHPERNVYQIGETYGSPELISSYISSGQMDAQFDFNLYDAMVDAFGKDESDFQNLQRVLEESMKYYGHHHMMGNITGNQDRARFISYADGSVVPGEDAKLAGWTRDIQNRGAEGYEKLRMLTAFMLTTPGIPCIYYGDEIGMPGGNDPDNRRMMMFDGWNEDQQKTYDHQKALIALRNKHMALIYGDTRVLKNDKEALVYCRTYMGQHALIVIDKSIQAEERWTLELPTWLQGKYSNPMSSMAIQCDGKSIQSAPLGKEARNQIAIYISQ